MNINLIGKTLVLLNLVLSALFMTFALAIFTQQIDWGWKEPREELGERVPAEIDKRSAAVKQLLAYKAKAENSLKAVQKEVEDIEQAWPVNHLWYVAELSRLQSAPGKIDIKGVKTDKGETVLNPNKKLFPVMDVEAAVQVTLPTGNQGRIIAEKSYSSYEEDLRKIYAEMETVNAEVIKLIDMQKDLTQKLDGVRDPDTRKELKPGLYGLLERESQQLKRLQQEMEYLRPLWVRELVDAQLLLERRISLQKRLGELKGRDRKVAAQ